MPDLNFEVEDAKPLPNSSSPLLIFKLRINNAMTEPIHSVMLRCQIMLEVTRRTYNSDEQARLMDLFGESDQWTRTLHNMFWTNIIALVPSFKSNTTVDLQVPCSFDFNVAATKYFAGVERGEIPLLLLLSGTVFYASENGVLQVTQIAWDKEARYRLPVQVWRKMMDTYYPNTVWLSLRKDAFDRLYEYKIRLGIPTFEQVLEKLIPEVRPDEEGSNAESSESKESIH